MYLQRTLKNPVEATGIGVHSGKRVRMRLLPAAAGHGIVFARVDVNPVVNIPISAQAVGDTRMASTLTAGDVRVSTVEHLMSACFGLGIDTLRIELDAEEVPIMDGSAATFAYLLESGGLLDLPAPKSFLKIVQPIEIREGEGAQLKWARLDAHHGFKLDFSIEFNHPAINATGKHAVFDFALHHYMTDMARARTFGFTHDVEMLRGMGLARGGSLDNAIVMDEYRMLNSGGLRYDDEFVRHKMLDAVGDLYLAGMPILGAYTAFKSGHALNNRLLRAAMAQGAAQVVTFTAGQADAPVLNIPLAK